MGVYQRGNEINLVQRFWTIDALTEVATLANPTTVVFTVENPDGTETVYAWNIASQVSNPATGVFVCHLPPTLPEGIYVYRCEGGGAVVASDEGSFEVLPSGVLAPSGEVSSGGPCSPWITGDDVWAFCSGSSSDTFMYEDVAADSSSIMFELSGRIYPGVCRRTVRPCKDSCRCFDASTGAGPWYWTSTWYGGTYLGWRDESGNACGCDALSEVLLSGYPVRRIVEVKIDGTPLPYLDGNGNANWRLDRRHVLVRMDDPANASQTHRYWPGCQNMALNDTEAGTFAVTYEWGMDVPSLGRQAAAQLGCELFKAYNNDKCALPSKVTKIVRQGVTMERIVAISDLLRKGSTGLQIVDAFLATANPTKMQRRPMVWSPDMPKFAREVGQ